jgi:UDP-glucose 4-epimerase
MSKVLVTGGAGWIGRAVCRRLMDVGHDARTFDRHNGYDIKDATSVDYAVKHADHVIHLAGVLGTHELFERSRLAVEVNVLGSFNVIEACARRGVSLVNITMPDVNPSLYAATKAAAMRLTEVYRESHGLKVSHVKAFNAYGPGQAVGPGHPQKIVPTFATAGWAGKPLPIWGEGNLLVDLVHVDDVARMLVDALDFTNGEVLDAGTGRPQTVFDIARVTICLTRSRSGVEWLPARVGERSVSTVADYANRPETIRRLGWAPEWDVDRFSETVRSYQP